MYGFKRVTIDQKIYDYDISGYVKYVGYVIPIMHGLKQYHTPDTVTVKGKEYECPHIKELSTLYHFGDENWVPVKGIFADITHRECNGSIIITGDYGRITVCRSSNEVIEFLEMLRDNLFSTPYYIYRTRDMGIDENEDEWNRLKRFACVNMDVCGNAYIKPLPRNKNTYYSYHVDIDELNEFIRDIRNGNVDFSVERITASTSTDPIEPEAKTSTLKKFTWRWSI